MGAKPFDLNNIINTFIRRKGMKKIFIGIDVSKETLDVTMIISSEDGYTVSSEAYVKVGNSEKSTSCWKSAESSVTFGS